MNNTPTANSSEPETPERAKPERDYAILVLKISGYTFLALLVFVAVSWGVFQTMVPSPQEVCAKKIELASVDAKNTNTPAFQSMIDRLRTNCVKDKKRRLKLRGQILYWQYASCVLEAETFADAELC